VARASDHLHLANRNQEALDFLIREDARFPEWVATVAFYKAVHVVESVFVVQGIEASTDHWERLNQLKRDRRFAKMHEHFRPLFNASLIARYLSDVDGTGFKTFVDYIPADQVKAKLVRHRLHQLEESGVKFLTRELADKLERAVPAPSPRDT
jgi:hypothetical protein